MRRVAPVLMAKRMPPALPADVPEGCGELRVGGGTAQLVPLECAWRTGLLAMRRPRSCALVLPRQTWRWWAK